MKLNGFNNQNVQAFGNKGKVGKKVFMYGNNAIKNGFNPSMPVIKTEGPNIEDFSLLEKIVEEGTTKQTVLREDTFRLAKNLDKKPEETQEDLEVQQFHNKLLAMLNKILNEDK